MKEKVKIVLFTMFVTAVFVVVVSSVHNLLKEKTAINVKAAKQKVLLKLLNLATDTANIDDRDALRLYDKNVLEKTISASGAFELKAFTLKRANCKILVIPFSGQGFWDNISGYISLNTAKQVITGIEFTEQAETPGLGGRIVEPAFKARFVGKPYNKIRSDGFRLKFVSEGTAKSETEVDGITGATGTTVALEKIINDSIANFVQIMQKGGPN